MFVGCLQVGKQRMHQWFDLLPDKGPHEKCPLAGSHRWAFSEIGLGWNQAIHENVVCVQERVKRERGFNLPIC